MEKSSDSTSIVFFGSGQISLGSVEQLSQQYGIEAVITRPDTTMHGQIIEPAIKTWAIKQRIPVFQPADKDELNNLIAEESFKSQVGVIAEYGLIIPLEVIDYFPRGIINSHFSLLPRWRGADPIRAAILAGDETTGVSIIKITPKLDEGDILAQIKLPIRPGATTPELTLELITLNNQLLPKALKDYFEGKLDPSPQNTTEQKPTYAPKITKADGQIDWAKPATRLEREVRAYLGWPGSYGQLARHDFIATKAHVVEDSPPAVNMQPGEIIPNKKMLLVKTGQDLLAIDRLKPVGKQEMTGADFIRGYLKT